MLVIRIRWLSKTLAVAALVVGNFAAAKALPDLHDAAQTYETFLRNQTQSYAEINAAYRAASASTPDDIALAVAQCVFIDNFLYAEDISWNDAAEADAEACTEGLHERWPEAPEVQLYRIENNYTDGALAEANQLWKTSEAWPQPMRARLASRLHYLHNGAHAPQAAARFALTAVRLGEGALLPEAISHLAAKGEMVAAIALADTASPATSSWQAANRIEALGKLSDKSAALRELRRSDQAGIEVASAIKVRVYLDAGDLRKAELAAKDIAANATDARARAAMFDLAMATGKAAQATAWVSLAHDQIDAAMQRYTDILVAAPQLAFNVSLLPMTLTMLAILVLGALLPGVLLVPVHYRGLMRRVQGRSPAALFERIGLRHAWIGAAVFLLVPVAMACVVRPDLVGAIFADGREKEMFAQFEVMVAGALAGLLLLSPWLHSLGWRHLFGERTHVGRTLVMVLLCWVGVFAVSMAIAQIHQMLGSGDTSTAQTQTVDSLVRTSRSEHGIWVTLMLIAVAVPLLEELVFRGMLLGGLSRHISFGWANTLQALLFAASHCDPPRFVFYLVLALSAGWLVRRNRTLWPAVLLHALNNGLVLFLHT